MLTNSGGATRLSVVDPARAPRLAFRICYWIAAALIVGWGAYLRFRLPLTPIADLDSWHFVNPALSALAGNGLRHTEGGSFFYPAFLLSLLRAIPHFWIITIVQHGLGIFGGILILLAWKRLRLMYHTRLVPWWMHEAGGLVLLAISLGAGTRLLFEHSLRPEAVTGFVMALDFLLILEFIKSRYLEKKRSNHSIAVGGLIVMTSFLLFLLKPSYALTMFFVTIPVWVSLFNRGDSWLRKCLLAGPALGVVLSLWLFEHQLSKQDKHGKVFLAATLFSIHADIIAEQMKDDLSRPGQLRYDRDWLSGIEAMLHEEIEKSKAGYRWRTLGFNPDFLLFEDSICQRISRDLKNRNQQCDFYDYYYVRAFRERPRQMIGKIGREMREFYSIGGVFREFQHPYSLSRIYTNGSIAFRFHPDEVEHSTLGQDFLKACALSSRNQDFLAQSSVVMAVLDLLAVLYLPALALSSGIGILSFFNAELRRRYGLPILIVLLFFSCNLGNCLATSVVHSLSVSRYIQAQFMATLVSESAGLLLVLEVLLWLVSASMAAKPSALTLNPV